MSVVEHVEALRVKHTSLKQAIEEENGRPHPNELRVSELKREKLKIKDEIFALESMH